MKCPNCKSVLSLKSNRCERCGEDVKVYKKIYKASNACYNQGLMKARVRDLSGAVMALRKSLELDKNNTNARNLLGLVYYEMGETVAALREWVISRNLQETDNVAEEYINTVQSNPTKLENTNQAIKKYNQALASAKSGNNDLAIIQLKKVVGLNSKFIRAYQLLALLYIESGEKDKAGKMLAKANAIDINNTTTIRYMNEIGMNPVKAAKEAKEEKKERREIREIKNPDYNAFNGMNEFKEDKPSILPWLNLIIGVVVGIVACYVLIKPTITSTKISDLTETNTKYQSQIASLQTKLDSANSKKEELQKKINELTGEKDEAEQNNQNVTTNVEEITNLLLESANLLLDNKKTEAAESLATVSEDSLTTDAQKDLYNTIKDATFESAAKSLYSEGYSYYERGKYDDALETLTKAAALKEDYEDANYIMARSYMKKGETEKARALFQQLIDEHPTSRRGVQAKQYIKQLPEADESAVTPSPSPTADANE